MAADKPGSTQSQARLGAEQNNLGGLDGRFAALANVTSDHQSSAL